MPIVLGGGISGLAAAFYLLKHPRVSQNVRLFEASSRFGGWIKTNYPTNSKKLRFEQGPRTLRPSGERGLNTLALCSQLGLNDDIVSIKSVDPAARNRLLAVNNELHLLPSSLTSIFKTNPPFTKPLISALLHDYKNRFEGERLQDDTMYNFAERRFGPEIAKYLISAMMCGICAGDAKEISVKFLLKDYFEFEQQHGSVTMGIYNKTLSRFTKKGPKEPIAAKSALEKRSLQERWSIYSFSNGLELLPNSLVKHLNSNGAELHVNEKCDNIEFHENKINLTMNGKSHETDTLVSSLPAFETARLVQKQHPTLAAELNAIPYVDVAVVNLMFTGKRLVKTPAFGFLVPPSENSPILGVIYDSCCFDMDDNTVFTVMMGGKWFNERFGDANEMYFYEQAIEQVQRILKINDKPDQFKVNVLRKCIPQYVVGHCDRIERINKYIEEKKLRLKLCGSAYDGVGVNDAIFSAKTAVEALKNKWE